jgi:futalosine hydrolase
MSERIDIAVLGAVAQEVEPLETLLAFGEHFEFLGEKFTIGRLYGRVCLVGKTGMGKVNAGIVASALLTRYTIGEVWNIGSAGAYTESGLRIGDVTIAREALCGDEGVLIQGRVLPCSVIGIPILSRGNQQHHDRIPLDCNFRMSLLQKELPSGRYRQPSGTEASVAQAENADENTDGFFRLVYGPTITVGMTSGDLETAAERFQRHGALAENMEGSGIAQACFRFDVPMVECRGISNFAGNRDISGWRLAEASAHALGIFLAWVERTSPQS